MMLYNLDWGKLRSYRIKRLTDQMEANNIDALILHGYLNTKYVTDFQMPEFHSYGESHDWVILLRKGEYVFFSNPFLRPETRKFCPWIKRIENPDQIWKVFEEFSLENAKIALDFIIPYAFVEELKKRFPEMQCVPGQKYLDEAKIIKCSEELEVMRKAAMIAEVGMSAGLEAVKPGVRESDIAAACEFAVWKHGGGVRPFVSYVATGENTAFLGEDILQRHVRKGDLVYIDMGCIFKGYVIEFCRTTICDEPTGKQKEIYQAVYRATQESFKIMREGCSISKIAKIQSDILSETGYLSEGEGEMPLHSIGIGYHEWPCDYLKVHAGWYPWKKEDLELRQGMVVNIEPGIFTGDPDIGGVRLEDTVEITKEGCHVLTKAPYCDALLS
jgi:Xaa-Pro dipeptidase